MKSFMRSLLWLLFSTLIVMLGKAVYAQTTSPQLTTIDFEDQSGPQLFGTASTPITISSVTFSGGQILTNATYLPADGTSVYGTANFCSGCLPTITMAFQQKASNVSFLLLNGEYFTITYTVEDDQGGSQQITLVANASEGAATITLPDSGIRQVTISGDPSTWDFEIDNISFSTDGAQLLDPVDSGFLTEYSGGAAITSDTDVLATGGTLVVGAGADGITQLLVRFPAVNVGDTFNLTVVDENGATAAVTANGGLFQLGAAPTTAASGVTVTAVNTVSGPMAFAVYLAPLNFARSTADYSLSSRNITLNILAASLTSAISRPRDTTSASTSTIQIRNPPIVLIHGLWADPTSWAAYRPLLPLVGTGYVDYSETVANVSATDPEYLTDNSMVMPVHANALAFSYNAPEAEKTILNSIKAVKSALNIGAVQADVVAHSMGGDVARSLVQLADFSQSQTFGAGPVHKLITIGTPHLGSPLAIYLLDPVNTCSSGYLATFDNPSYTSVTIGTQSFAGAVYDLKGMGDGTQLSEELTTLLGLSMPFPIAYIGGWSGPANLQALNTEGSRSKFIHNSCALANPMDYIASALTPSGWPALLPGETDSVVPVTSQYDLNASDNNLYSGVIHSQGLTALDFTQPTELNDPRIINAVLLLLNVPTTDPHFHAKEEHR